jgi:hypothetical protein
MPITTGGTEKLNEKTYEVWLWDKTGQGKTKRDCLSLVKVSTKPWRTALLPKLPYNCPRAKSLRRAARDIVENILLHGKA